MFEAFKWALAILSLIGVVMNIRRDRRCFYIWAVTNASWCAVDIIHAVWSQAALMAVYFCLAIWGLIKWKNS